MLLIGISKIRAQDQADNQEPPKHRIRLVLTRS